MPRVPSAPDRAGETAARPERVLLLMTTNSYRAGAFLEAARRLGVDAIAGTDRPQALAALNPGAHLALDFGHANPAVEAIVTAARSRPIAAIVAAEDEGTALAALAAERLGLAHASVAGVLACRDKHRMRVALEAGKLRTPRFECVSTADDPRRLAERATYPCVLKPLHLSGSRGVMRADDPEQFVAAFDRVVALLKRPDVRGSEAILIEEYLPGIEVALEGLLSAGRLRPLALFDKPDPLEGPTFEETLYVTPSRLAAELQAAIVETTERAAAALRLDHGPIHAELRITDGVPWVVEIAPRSIGGLCSRALRFGNDVGLEELILRHALGREWETLEREPRASGVMMIPIPRAGVLRSVQGLDPARRVDGIEDIRITIPAGSELVPLPEGSRYLGFIFARAESPEQVELALRESHRRLEFEIVPGH